jgi:tetratricopeptide (TPR) repeat protein
MRNQLEASIVRIFADDGAIVGAGFLAAENIVLTCAHVIAGALKLATDEETPTQTTLIHLDFPLVAAGCMLKAQVTFWQPPKSGGGGDIAVLHLKSAPPPGAQPSPLLIVEDLWGHTFRAFGFPFGYDNGVWASGMLSGRQATNWVQIEPLKDPGYRVQPGFSGSPVWDEQLDGVVGMVVESDRQAHTGAAFIILADTLVTAWPELKSHKISLGKLNNVPNLPPHFLSRPHDLVAIKALLLADIKNPVIVNAAARKAGLHGMSGIGKTVMATAIARDSEIQQAFPDGVLWVTLGQSPNVKVRQADLCRSLGDPPQTFEDIQQGKARLSELLIDKACLIVLDDVCELEHAAAFDVMGPHSGLLITARDARIITALGAVEHQLAVLSEDEALKLLAHWLSSRDGTLDNDELEYLAQVKAHLPIEAHEVARECGYLPLALALSAAQVRDGASWEDVLQALHAVELDFLDHPHGSVLKSLKSSIDRLQAESPDQAKHYLELAVFPKNVAVPEETVLMFWMHTGGLKKHNARRLLSVLAGKALLQTEGERSQRRVSLHDLQHDYLRYVMKDKLEGLHIELLSAYHQSCSTGWPSGPNDGYFFEHLADHLLGAGRKAELISLLTNSPDWMNAKFAACTGDAAFIADLELAQAGLTDPLAASEMLTLVRLYTAHQVVRTRVSSYTNEDLRILVLLGRREEALSHARLRHDAKEQFDGLLTIYDALPIKGELALVLLKEAFEVVGRIQNDEERLNALRTLLALLIQSGQVEQRETVVSEIVHTLAKQRTARDQIVKQQDGLGRQTEIDLIFRENPSVWIMENEVKPQTEENQIVDILMSSEYLDEAVQIASHFYDAYSREKTLNNIVTALIEEERYDEAVKVAIHHLNQAETLCGVVEKLVLIGQQEQATVVLAKAVELAHLPTGDWTQIDALCDVAVKLEQIGEHKQAAALLTEALEVVQNTGNTDEYLQQSGLSGGLLDRLINLLTASNLFDEAVAAACLLANTYNTFSQHNNTLYDLVAKLIQIGRQEQATIVLAKTTAVTRPPKGDWTQIDEIDALCYVAVKLVQMGERGQATHLLAEKLEVAHHLEHRHQRHLIDVLLAADDHEQAAKIARLLSVSDGERADIFCDIAEKLVQDGKIEQAISLLEETLEMIPRIKTKLSKVMIASKLATVLEKAGLHEQAGIAFSEMLTIVDRDKNHRLGSDILQELASALVQTERYQEAINVASKIHWSSEQLRALSQLATTMVQSGHYNDAIDAISAIQDPKDRSLELTRLGSTLLQLGQHQQANTVFTKALTAAGKVRPNWRVVQTLIEEASMLAKAGYPEQAKAALNKALKVGYRKGKQTDDRGRFGTELPEELPAPVFSKHCYQLIAMLIQTGRLEVAIHAASKSLDCFLQNTRFEVGVISVLVQANSTEEAITVANSIHSADYQAYALKVLAFELIQANRIEEAISVANSIHSADYQASALIKIAYELTQSGQSERAYVVFTKALALEAAREGVRGTSDYHYYNQWAEEAYEKSIEQASRLRELASLAAQLGRHKQAKEIFAESLSAACHKYGEDHPNLDPSHELFLKSIIHLGMSTPEQRSAEQSKELSKLVDALVQVGYFEIAISAASKIQNDAEQSSALTQIAYALAQTGDVEKALQIALSIQKEEARDDVLCDLMDRLMLAGSVERAIDVARNIGDGQKRADGLRGWACQLASKEKFEQATAIFSEVVDAEWSIKDEKSWIEALSAVAIILARRQQYKQAMEVFSEAKKAVDNLRDKPNGGLTNDKLLDAFCTLIAALLDAGWVEIATDILQEEIVTYAEASRRYGDRNVLYGLASRLHTLSSTLVQQGHLEQALVVAKSALSAVDATRGYGDKWSGDQRRMNILCSLSIVMGQVRAHEEAAAIFLEAVREGYRVHLPSWATNMEPLIQPLVNTLTKLIPELVNSGRPETVITIFKEVMKMDLDKRSIRSRDFLPDLDISATLCPLIAEGQMEQAITILQESIEIGSVASVPNSRNNLLLDLEGNTNFKNDVQTFKARDVSGYLQTLAQWASAFERVEEGLSVAILYEAIRIVGWINPGWREIYKRLGVSS